MMAVERALSGMSLTEIEEIVKELNLPRYNAKQIASWLYTKQVFSFDEMTNLSKAVREKLSSLFVVGRSRPVESVKSKDGTIKYLFRTLDGHFVETVYIPSDDRATLCVSSQVGCKMGCRFCMTGRQKFHGQLSTADILNQVYGIPEHDKLTNIVFMGQGEPFDNTDNVIRATQILTASYSLAWSPKRITVSTIGALKGMKRFLDMSDCNLAVSLHFPTHELRAEWMPIENAYPIERVVELLKTYEFCRDLKPGEIRGSNHQRRLSFEYIVFKGVNDGMQHAQEIVRLLKGLDCRVNLIPFHAIPNSPLHGASTEEMMKMRDYLTRHGVFTTLRASRGQDIEAACGLLSTAKYADAE